ncbi:hypothetical protein BJX99DRAFT_690 [Aspergillus californicus]
MFVKFSFLSLLWFSWYFSSHLDLIIVLFGCFLLIPVSDFGAGARVRWLVVWCKFSGSIIFSLVCACFQSYHCVSTSYFYLCIIMPW